MGTCILLKTCFAPGLDTTNAHIYCSLVCFSLCSKVFAGLQPCAVLCHLHILFLMAGKISLLGGWTGKGHDLGSLPR